MRQLAKLGPVPTDIPVGQCGLRVAIADRIGTVPANRTLSHGFGTRSAAMACTV